jgi:hypothetical protein
LHIELSWILFLLTAKPGETLYVFHPVERVNEAASGVHAIQSRFEPAAGALLLALDSMNILTDATLLERLESTLSGPAFFAT